MKAICINNSGVKELKEGNVYTVIKVLPPVFIHEGFLLQEIKSKHYTGAYLSNRFIPCSEIDENEIIYNTY